MVEQITPGNSQSSKSPFCLRSNNDGSYVVSLLLGAPAEQKMGEQVQGRLSCQCLLMDLFYCSNFIVQQILFASPLAT